MTVPVLDLVPRLKTAPSLDAEATLAMRQVARLDGTIDPAEAEAIFELNCPCAMPAANGTISSSRQ